MLQLIVMEGLIGAMIGVLGRVFFSALESLATVAGAICWASPIRSASRSTRGQATPPLVDDRHAGGDGGLISSADFHWEIMRGLVASYDAIPLRTRFRRRLYGASASARCSASRSASRCGSTSPFFLYSVIANFALTPDQPGHAADLGVLCRAAVHRRAADCCCSISSSRRESANSWTAFAAWLTWG